MIVRMLATAAGPNHGALCEGKVYDLPNEAAKRMLAYRDAFGKAACVVCTSPSERATAEKYPDPLESEVGNDNV